MARVTTEAVLGAGTVGRVLAPRQGLVLEELEHGTDDGAFSSFRQAAGPLAFYRRTVEIEPLGRDQYRARQVVEMRVGLPWWSWLLSLPLRFSLGRAQGGGSTPMPWWAPPQRLNRRQAVMMAALAAIVSVQGYLAALLPESLTYAAGEMHVGTFGQGAVFASVELSAVPALLALVVADRRGRRSVVLWATGMAVVLTELGGLAPSMTWLTVTQVGAGALLAAAGIAAIVVAVEEVPRGCRAWAVGVLGMAVGFGGGGALLLLPVAGTGPGGWRWLYGLSLLCLPVVAICARQLPESRRWLEAKASGPGAARMSAVGTRLTAKTEPEQEPAGGDPARVEPARLPPAQLGEGPTSALGWARGSLAPRLRSPTGRLALVCAGAVLFALFAVPASQFQAQFLRQQRGYGALGISVLQQATGTIGVFGVLVGGRLADTHGRRPVAVACVIGATATTLWSYAAHGWTMWLAATTGQFFLYATVPVLGVYGAELFATRARARSAGLVAASSAIGGVSGLLAVGALAAHFGTLGPALAAMAVGPVLLVLLLLVGYPETAGVTLEQLAPLDRDDATIDAHVFSSNHQAR